MTTAIEQTLETYGIENWAAGYFDVNRKGNLIVRPVEGDPRSADLKEIIDDLAKRGIKSEMPAECYSNPDYEWSKAMGKQ